MLRLTLISVAILIGTYFAFRSPFYALLFYLGNAYFRPEEWVHTDLIRSLNLSYLIGCYVVISSVFSKAKFVCNGRVLLMLLFLLHAILSTAMSQYAFYSWPFLVEFIKVVLITYFIVIFVTDFWKFRLVIIVMVLALGLEQSKQGWFYLLTSPGGANMNPVAFLGDNNGTALGMLMLVPMSAFLFQTSKEKMTKVACAGILVGCLYRALSTYSRGGFLAAIAMAVAWWLQSFHKLRFVFGLVVILLIVVPVLPSAFWKPIPDEEKKRWLSNWAAKADGIAWQLANENSAEGRYNHAYWAWTLSPSIARMSMLLKSWLIYKTDKVCS